MRLGRWYQPIQKGRKNAAEIKNSNAAFGCYIEKGTVDSIYIMLESGKTLNQMALIAVLALMPQTANAQTKWLFL